MGAPWSVLLLVQLFIQSRLLCILKEEGMVTGDEYCPIRLLYPRRYNSRSWSISSSTSSGESTENEESDNFPDSRLYFKGNDASITLKVEDPAFNDPLFQRQWYLYNKNTPGHDINVLPVWKEGITGKGVVIALIDDGVDYEC